VRRADRDDGGTVKAETAVAAVGEAATTGVEASEMAGVGWKMATVAPCGEVLLGVRPCMSSDGVAVATYGCGILIANGEKADIIEARG